MKFFHTFDVAASGMRAEQFKMDLISENIANAHTTKTDTGGPYRRKLAVTSAQDKAQFDSEFASANFDVDMKPASAMSSFSGGGVSCEAALDKQEFKLVYDPSHPNADEKGYVKMPNVNIINEMTSMMQATRSYEANSTIIESAKSMAMKALEIGRG